MDDWRPRPKDRIDFEQVDLEGDNGLVFNLIDGNNSIQDVAVMSGVPEERVREIVDELAQAGAIDASAGPVPGEEPAGQAGRTHRRLFETELHRLPAGKRAALAKTASDDILIALCYDPDPKVIHAVLDNLQCGPDHARLIAEHHRNPAGLEGLGRKARFMQDDQVRRLLLRNVQAPESLLRRALGPLTLPQLFKILSGRDNTERAKRLTRKVFRQQFQRATPDQRVALIFKSEGRCLLILIGLPLDGKTTAYLCRRTYQSTMLVQNLARFPGTQPQLIRHLFRQPILKRAPHLRKLLLKHPNCPAELKRGM